MQLYLLSCIHVDTHSLMFSIIYVFSLTLPGFLYFWGLVFFTTTTLVWIFKSEHLDPDLDPDTGIVDTYKHLYQVIKLKPVISHCIILLTSKVCTFCLVCCLICVIYIFMPPPFEEWWRGIKCYPCPCVRSFVRPCVRPLSKFGVRSITFERLHRFDSYLAC